MQKRKKKRHGNEESEIPVQVIREKSVIYTETEVLIASSYSRA